MVDFTIHIDPDAEFLRIDPQRTVKENVHTMLVGMAAWGEQSVQAQWAGSTRGRSGATGRVNARSGKPWQWHAVVTPEFTYPWMEHRSAPDDAQYRGGKSSVRNRAFKSTKYRIGAATRKFTFDLNQGVWL